MWQVEFTQVLAADPQNAAAYYGKGYAYYLEGDHAASTEVCFRCAVVVVMIYVQCQAYSMALQLDPEPTAKKISRPTGDKVPVTEWAHGGQGLPKPTSCTVEIGLNEPLVD